MNKDVPLEIVFLGKGFVAIIANKYFIRLGFAFVDNIWVIDIGFITQLALHLHMIRQMENQQIYRFKLLVTFREGTFEFNIWMGFQVLSKQCWILELSFTHIANEINSIIFRMFL